MADLPNQDVPTKAHNAKPSGAELIAWLKTVRPTNLTEVEIDEQVAFAVNAIREDRDNDHGHDWP